MKFVVGRMAEGPMPPLAYGDPLTSVSVEFAPIVNMRTPPGLLVVLVKATVSPTYTTGLVRSTATAVSPAATLEFLGPTIFTAPKGFPDVDAVNGMIAIPVVPTAANT